MTPDDHEQATALFLAVAELTPPERASYLDTHCDRADLRVTVEALLAADADDALRDVTRAHDGLRRTVLAITGDGDVPASIGPFEILEELGRGGMGIVYEARQQVPQRAVALKVVRPAYATEAVVRRFEHEIEILGRLQHDGVAKVFLAGFAGDEEVPRPFFAMELLRGEPLLDHAHAAGLVAADRVRLMVKVCDAVHHAHLHGVVHRDLKPSNILVEPSDQPDVDPVGQPKILDFGIASLNETHGSSWSVEDGAASSDPAVGTLAYMSPEQAASRTVDARADVYALGVLLYELLTGELPVPVRSLPLAQALSAITDQPPAGLRAYDPSIDPNLEAVVLRALEKDPDCRYASASELRSDLIRALEHRAVEARPASPLEHARLFTRRHRLAVSLVSGASLLLLAALIAVIISWRKEGEASALAQESDRRVFEVLGGLPALFDLFDRDEQEDDVLEIRVPAQVPIIEGWLERAEPFAAMHEELAWARDRVEADERDPEVRRWLLEEIEQTEQRLAEIFGPTGWVSHARMQLDRIAEAEQVTLYESKEQWNEAIAQVHADPRFEGLTLTPQFGLVPLGANVEADLQEFWVWGTGDEPEWVDGAWRVDGETAVVLVLVPGGTKRIGIREPRWQGDGMCPVHDVSLAPYFMGKYELTQGQYARLSKTEPSRYRPGTFVDSERIKDPTLAHPVEQVARPEALFALRRVGLTLPTEAQWEAAARGGTASKWSCEVGVTYARLFEVANLADRSAIGLMRGDLVRDCDDGFGITAPVGSLAANPFGLHDVHGNVSEWCLDAYHPRAYETRSFDPVSGLRRLDAERGPASEYVVRGGSLVDLPSTARSGAREGCSGLQRQAWLGVRAARPVHPPKE